MKPKIFLLVSALVALAFALVMTFVPLQFLQWLGFETGGFTLFLARDYATAMLAFAIGLWMVRNERASLALQVVLLMWGLFHLAEVVVNLGAFIAGSLQPTTKLAAIPLSLHVVFTIGSVYYLVKLREVMKMAA